MICAFRRFFSLQVDRWKDGVCNELEESTVVWFMTDGIERNQRENMIYIIDSDIYK